MIKQRDTYKFCTNCRTELLSENEFKLCPGCQKQYFFNSKPTICVVLTNGRDEVLLTKRAHEPFKDWWDLPGGFVEEGETLEQAVARELKEETSLSVTNLKYLGSIPEDYEYRNEIIPVVAAVFSGTANDNEQVTVADDVSDYKFVPRGEVDIDSIAFDNQREFLRDILK